MEAKVYKNKRMSLLRPSFKKIGLIFALTSIMIAVLLRVFLPGFRSNVLALVLMDFVIIGLLIVALSGEKIDDERVMFIRLRAILAAFIFAIIYTVSAPLLNPLFGDVIKDISGQLVILNMLLIYHMWFWYLKRAGK